MARHLLPTLWCFLRTLLGMATAGEEGCDSGANAEHVSPPFPPPPMQLCDVISRWEQALRERHLGKVENTRVICLTFRNRSLLLPFSPPRWSRVWVLLCPRWPTTGRGQEEGNGALPLGLPKLWLHNVGRGSLRGRSWPTPCGSPGKACVGVPGLK